MLYLSSFYFPTGDGEFDFFNNLKRRCFNTYYPFQVLPSKGLRELSFEPVTILYGGNGSGKTTVLNIIAEKLGLQRDTLYNRSNFFEDYTRLCDYELEGEISEDSRIITSDDVFDFMLNLRTINEGVDRHREELYDEYRNMRRVKFQLQSLEDYDYLKKMNSARSRTQSRYVREQNGANVREHSNGESAFQYFTDKITEDGLYLLDEPENSLSPQRQQELVKFIEDSVRFFGCQFIIATHSPFLLAMQGAKVYDMDQTPVQVRKWTQLGNVRTYYDFFKKHEEEFKNEEY